ncbi:hypothetical protein VNI00_016145 [Paramarasmius palmivorus]|uniref:Uncharacterized protein n=1 Tax=Paramarasmius palmivorus TaxID=297713 RepID=A0AAW0BE09_9AGAR
MATATYTQRTQATASSSTPNNTQTSSRLPRAPGSNVGSTFTKNNTPFSTPNANSPEPPKSPNHERGRPQSDGRSSDTARRSPREPSANSLFSGDGFAGGSISANSIFDETNRVALKRGKAPLRTLQTSGTVPSSEGKRSPSPWSVQYVSDDENQSHRLPSLHTSQSHISETQVRAYHNELRRRYILSVLRDYDLMNYSTTYIESQDVYIDGDGMVYHYLHPQIRQIARPIEDVEIMRLRTMHPEPFSSNDPNRYRRPREKPRNDTAIPEEELPKKPAAKKAVHRNTEPPRGPIRPKRHRNDANARSNERQQEEEPPNAPGNGGPPGDDPPGGSHHGSDPSEPEDNNSENDADARASAHSNSRRNARNKSPTPDEANVRARMRHPSEDPALDHKKEWVYDPTPQSDHEMLKSAFKIYEELIEAYLLCEPTKKNSSIQKTLMQSVAKPTPYGGEDDLVIFDMFVRDSVRWLNTADLCGPDIRWSATKKAYVLTTVDMQRTNALAAFLKGSAKQWFVDVVERIPDINTKNDPLQGRWTFMQVVSGLYRRFIHEASLTKVTEKYESITYSRSRGVEGLFDTLKKYAKSLPIPPDAYNFRKRLLLLLPSSMAEDLARIHQITAEHSTLTQIMEAAIKAERGERALTYYHEARRNLERTKRKKSRSRSKERKRHPTGDRRRDGSPRRLQVVDRRRYSVKPHSERPKDERPQFYPVRPGSSERKDKPKYERKDNQPFVKPRFPSSAKPDRTKGNVRPGQVFRMTDDDGNTRLCRILDIESPENENSGEPNIDQTNPDDQEIWSRYENESLSGDESDKEYSPSSYEGSQYDPGTESEADERTGFMRDYIDSGDEADYEGYTLGERFAHLRDDSDAESVSSYNTCLSDYQVDEPEALTLDFPEYIRTMKIDEDGGVTATLEPKPVHVPKTGKRPKRTNAEKRCFAAWILINGVKAFVLFDSGSTADAISPDFARLAKLKMFRLEDPVTLQLGTKGSRSRITYGCTTRYSILTNKDRVSSSDYFDIANIDRYDAVVGTVFMRRHGIDLAFSNDTIKMKDSVIPTLSEGEELTELARRASKRVADSIQLNDGEEIEVKKRPKKYGVVEDRKSSKSKANKRPTESPKQEMK